ncbi:MAG: TIGR03936 family radical SAM-associated protein [Tepidanaerobacteraceae bacterium]|nr:TIGR03936 family radical SAM-associated protein [Tepidanaerobacteraceae bacterium]
MKLRLRFKKEGLARFISHLDLMRTFERAFRRAELPIAFSQGFNPRPKMTFASALSVGISSSSEYLDVEFSEDVSASDVALKLNPALPEGIKVTDVKMADEAISLSMLNGAKYVVRLALNEVDLEELKKSTKGLLEQKEIIIEKRTKSGKKLVNIAPFIYSLGLSNCDGSAADIVMSVAIGQQGSVAPTMVINELERILCKELEIVSIHREAIFYKSNGKEILPM